MQGVFEKLFNDLREEIEDRETTILELQSKIESLEQTNRGLRRTMEDLGVICAKLRKPT
jgi:predicted RNase H-like nuclease (RuvC/YqgF family)